MDSRSVLQIESTGLTEGWMWWDEGERQSSLAQAAECMGRGCLLRCFLGVGGYGRSQRIKTPVLGVLSLRCCRFKWRR